jgi:hypothetical protein
MSRLRKTLEGIEIEEEITLDLRRSDSTLIGAFPTSFFRDYMTEEAEEFVKTSLKLPLKLWRDIKFYAAKEGLKLMQVVEAALRKYLELSEEEKRK